MSSAFDVTRVQVVGTSGPLSAQIEQAVSSNTHGKSLLGMDAGAVQRRVEAIPFVRSARVDRAFPHTLAVHVVPYTPAAYAMIGKQVYPIAGRRSRPGRPRQGAAGGAGRDAARRDDAGGGAAHRRREHRVGARGAEATRTASAATSPS